MTDTMHESGPRPAPQAFERRDTARLEAFESGTLPQGIGGIRLDDDEFGGIRDTYAFPVIMAVATIALAVIYGSIMAHIAPHLLAERFVSFCAILGSLTAIPLAVVASIRERRKWRSHKALRSIASLDPLTGVMNRRSFSVSLEEELNRMKRTRHAAAVILFDLDHFKRLNDEFGHHVGDEVLTGVASIAYSELRNPFDRLARWGGEEFIILLHDMSEETAKGVSERLRHRIAELVLEKSGEDVKVTASFGGSLLRPDQSFSEALHQADLALYEAKSNGRNRVEFRRCLQLAA